MAPPRSRLSSKKRPASRNIIRLPLRRIEVWLPDIHSAAFKAEARRQAKEVANGDRQHADQMFIDAISIIEWK
jgi:hypothetical protein